MPLFRRKLDDERELTAAARSLDIANVEDDAGYMRAILGHMKATGREPWHWYDTIGEIHYAIDRGARVAGYADLYVAKLGRDGRPGDPVTRGLQGAIASRLISPYGGTRELLSRFYRHMTVPGDSVLIRHADRQGRLEGFETLSADEVDGPSDNFGLSSSGWRDGFKRVVAPKISERDKITQQIPVESILGRVWRPSARWIDLADTPMHAISGQAEMLDMLTKGIKGRLLSRLALNGILFVPSQLNQIAAVFPGGPEMSFLDRLLFAATQAVLKHDDPKSSIPIFVSGDKDLADAIQFIEADRQIYETDMRLRQELIDRILMSLDVQPMDVKGMGDSNHWSAWAVSDDERRVNIQPVIESFCWAATRLILHREMIAEGRSPAEASQYVVWYDLSAANVKTNLAEDARQLDDRGHVSPKAVRRMSGVSEADAPSEVEQVRSFGRKHGDPYLATYGLAVAEQLDWDKVGKGGASTGPAADSPADTPKVGPGTGKKPGGPTPESNTPRAKRPA